MAEYLQPLLERLAGILHSRPSVELQAGALSAISSSAAAAGSRLHAICARCPGTTEGVHGHHRGMLLLEEELSRTAHGCLSWIR